MKIPIDRIVNEEKIEVSLDVDFSNAQVDFKLKGPAKAKLIFEHIGKREIRVSGEIEATLILTCVDCLDEFEYPLKIEVDETYSPYEKFDYTKEERPIEELSEFSYHTNYLDVFEIVRDNILEFIPPYPKCPKCASKSNNT